jgi:hypothetical protein
MKMTRKAAADKKQVPRRSIAVISPAAVAQVGGGTGSPPPMSDPAFSPERTQQDPNGP